ncbi:uncharacterized protein BDZ99DRAFT_468517 [Mytilinidion resinicola]|uniref:Myb-like domain-containing protein n=1 Tax=Mytilinidion resinicola TaxID=574789 RepID=A0A6A6Y3E5_9PEZI|nr:uncharacterized protein BDZ99DRAFT_468517 [Mytilinidion resinicola]KAF2803180.1 hypothetical protein BDZ99DRAFT_468517 [Mytilinidion resinicola]
MHICKFLRDSRSSDLPSERLSSLRLKENELFLLVKQSSESELNWSEAETIILLKFRRSGNTDYRKITKTLEGKTAEDCTKRYESMYVDDV